VLARVGQHLGAVDGDGDRSDLERAAVGAQFSTWVKARESSAASCAGKRRVYRGRGGVSAHSRATAAFSWVVCSIWRLENTPVEKL
jgi:hypothetical protein